MNKYYNINNLFDENGDPIKVTLKIKRKNNYIDYKTAYESTYNAFNNLYKEYSEVKKQKDDVVEYIKYLIKRLEEFDIPKRKETGAFWYQVMGELEEVLRMLGERDDN